VHPQPETYWGNVNPIGVRSVYDESKRFSEAATMAYHRFHGLDTAIVRIFNTYGPRMRPDDGRAIPTFISQALRGAPLTVHGHRRADPIDHVHRRSGPRHPAAARLDRDGPINCGTEHELSMLELAELIVGSPAAIRRSNWSRARPDDPEKRRPDLTLARTGSGTSRGSARRRPAPHDRVLRKLSNSPVVNVSRR
jgi:dTDP-glucose 4,6-dehydratase